MFRNRLIVTVCTILLLTGLPFGQALAGTAYAAPAAAPIAAGRAPAQSNSMPPGRPQTVDSTPTYSVTWTATAAGFSDTTDGIYRWVKNRQITMSGSGIWRQISSVDWVYSPYKLIVTDDLDTVLTTQCTDPAHPGSGSRHWTRSITDPSRYTGDTTLNASPIIRYPFTPTQLPDGSWYMWIDMIINHDFSYRVDDDGGTGCGAVISPSTSTGQGGWYEYFNPQQDLYLSADAQGKTFTSKEQYVLAYQDPPLTVQWNVTVRVLESRDLTVNRLEVTQGLQDEANSIPLVQGRRTVVRAFIDVGPDQVPVPDVTGKLNVYTGSTLLGSVPASFNPGGKITAPVAPDWHQINDTLNFELPYEWTLQPNLRLEVEVNPDHTVVEGDYANNKTSQSVSLAKCSGIDIGYVPIGYAPSGSTATGPSINISNGEKFLLKVYPVPDKPFSYHPVGSLIWSGDVNQPFGIDLLLLKLWFDNISSPGHIFGWLPSDAFAGNGKANALSAAVGNDTESPNRWRRTLAHEIGHNYQLPDQLTPLTTGAAHWFDVEDRVIKPVPATVGGNELLDLMTPGRLEEEAWISPQNYRILFAQMCTGSGAASAAATPQSLAVADTLLVTGIISNTTPAAASLEPLYRFTTVPTDTLPVGGQYCVNLKNVANALLSQYCFNQGFTDDSGTPAGSMPFGMVVPYPAGLNRVELVQGATVLASRVKSTNSPTVTVTFPNAAGLTLSGNHNITWTGSDLDGNPLTYNILYSRDNGATWVGIGNGITGTTYNLDFSELPGTTVAGGKIKVMVSDGFNSAEDISDNPFTVGNKPPVAAIISPPSGAAFTIGPKVVLEGVGMDLENGSLGDSALSWVSSIDGALGAGQLLEVNLSPGVHTITLTATDSGGLTRTASIQITVVLPPPTVKHLFLPLITR